MKAVLWDEPFSDPGWIYERKLDGVRCLAHRDAGGAVRSARAPTARMNADYPELVRRAPGRAARGLRRRRRGRGLRQAAASRASPGCQRRARERRRDLLLPVRRAAPRRPGRPRAAAARAQGGAARRARLRRPGPLQARIATSDGEELFREACRKGLEGIIAKRADSPYRADALERLAQAQVPRRAGAGDRRLHRAAGLAHGLRRAAGRLLRGRRAALRRQGRHRLRPRHAAHLGSRMRELERDDPPFAHVHPIPRGTHWSSPSWSRRSRSASGPATAACATPATSGCATTRRPATSSGERPA